MPLQVGQTLENRYRIAALLGQGGMGAVYRGTDLRFNAPVAIKENRLVTAESQKQFAREAGLLYRLRHPNLPRVIDHFAIADQGQYLVMDYVDGQDLKEILARHGPLPEPQALEWIDQVLDALHYLHGEKIIHRDVKPANVKITPRGQLFLVDFGLAKVYDPRQQTTIGARGVTPGYAPPEQYGQGRTDARSDVYSAAATLYSLLTGHTPPDALDFMTRRVEFVPPRRLNPSISPLVEAAILKAMAMAPDDRFQTTSALRRALSAGPAPSAAAKPAAPPAPRAAVRAAEVPATPAPAPSRPASRPASAPAQRRRPARPKAPAAGREVAAPAPPEPKPQGIRWKRAFGFALFAFILGIAGAIFEAAEVLPAGGHFVTAFVVLILLVYYARRPLQRTRSQYQTDVFALWLGVTPGYLAILALLDDYFYPSEVLLGTAVMFWLPSVLLGVVVLGLARRRALRRG
jgi:hypothetical protein